MGLNKSICLILSVRSFFVSPSFTVIKRYILQNCSGSFLNKSIGTAVTKEGIKSCLQIIPIVLIFSHIMAKLMLLLPFSSLEICVLQDLRRTENAGWNFYSVNEFLFEDVEKE